MSGRTWGGVLILSGLALSSVPWYELSRAEPPRQPCSFYDVDCGELFRGRIACANYVNYGYHGPANQVEGWLADSRKIRLPVARCVFITVPK